MRELSPPELRDRMAEGAVLVLDVRQDEEWAIAHLPGSTHMPMGSVQDRVDELPRGRAVVVVCHHGIRSERVARYLENNGFTDVAHLRGGLDAWALEIDADMPRY